MVKPKSPKSLFGRRLREARESAGISQYKLGVIIGFDEGSSSARMSRYEAGIHSPPFQVAEQIAKKLKLPVAYFYCSDDRLAEIMRLYHLTHEKGRAAILECAIHQTGFEFVK
jgi:transcriptional regulator with XRE-family HTH domain